MKDKLSFKLEVFEGPLELLMHLIEKNKVNIYDIPIAEITDQYLGYLEYMEVMDLDISSEFLLMASNLLYIKSKMLLPKYSEPDEDDEDPRQELVDKLLEYQKYKQISEVLNDRQCQYQSVFYKEPEKIEFVAQGYEAIILSIEDLLKAFDNIYMRKKRLAPPPKESFNTIVNHEKISIQLKASEILKRLNKHTRIRFLDIFEETQYRPEIVARFLAILELVRANQIMVVQINATKDIYIMNVENNL